MKKLFILIISAIAIYFFSAFIFIQAKEQPQKIITAMAEKNLAEFISAYKAALAGDTYGGQTPEETWQMFVGAVVSNDSALAEKYFWAEPKTEIEAGGQVKESDFSFMSKLALAQGGQIKISQRVFENPELDFLQNDSDIRYYEFFVPVAPDVPSSSAVIAFPISFKFNQYSKVWKIKRF